MKTWDGMGRASSMHGTHVKCWAKKLIGRDHKEDLGVNESIILKCISQKSDDLQGLNLSGLLRYGPVSGSCERANVRSSSLKGGEFLV
jgi:hypothetical protein